MLFTTYCQMQPILLSNSLQNAKFLNPTTNNNNNHHHNRNNNNNNKIIGNWCEKLNMPSKPESEVV